MTDQLGGQVAVSNAEVQDAVDRIKAGDTVTARVGPTGSHPYTVTGVVERGYLMALALGPIRLADQHGRATTDLLAIESHEPAKPPVPPEPTGDAGTRALGVR